MDLHERVAAKFKLAVMTMPLPDALRVLGFPPNATPSDEEVNRAQRKKVLDVHPDRGGDHTLLVEVNNAADALRAYNDRGHEGYTGPEPPSGYTHTPRPKPDPVRISWDEAKADASVPSGVTWKFKTQNAWGGHGDTSVLGFVAVGQLDPDKWVFVAVENYRSRNAFTGEDVDEWWMKTQLANGALRDVAPTHIRQMFKFPHVNKQFNAKVEIFPEGVVFNEKMANMHGVRAVSFKDAMEILGELKEGDPWKGRKLQVVMVLNRDRDASAGDEYKFKDSISFIVNGREHKLSDESVEFLKTKTKVLGAVYGTYYYFTGDKKMLTKAKNGKKVLEYLAEKLTHEPQTLRDLLSTAAGQM